MNKTKRNIPLYTVVVVMGIVAIGVIAFASTGYTPKILLQSGAILNFNEAETPVAEEKPLGGISGPDVYTDYWCENDYCYIIKSGELIDASTTIVSVQNPFGASSTVDMMALYIENGTTTANIQCGTSTAGFIQVASSSLTLFDFVLATSTAGTATTTVYVENGQLIASTSVAGFVAGSFTAANEKAIPGSLSQSIIFVDPDDYITCFAGANSIYKKGSEGVVGVNNMFRGRYSIRFNHTKLY
jgi:hypothetical protein